MKFCQAHGDALRGAIDDRGLSHLVSQGGAELTKHVENELKGGPVEQTWDPLWSAFMGITNNALRCAGLWLMQTPPEGLGWTDDKGERFFCPLCELDVYQAERKKAGMEAEGSADWIQSASNEALNFAQKMGMLETPVLVATPVVDTPEEAKALDEALGRCGCSIDPLSDNMKDCPGFPCNTLVRMTLSVESVGEHDQGLVGCTGRYHNGDAGYEKHLCTPCYVEQIPRNGA